MVWIVFSFLVLLPLGACIAFQSTEASHLRSLSIHRKSIRNNNGKYAIAREMSSVRPFGRPQLQSRYFRLFGNDNHDTHSNENPIDAILSSSSDITSRRQALILSTRAIATTAVATNVGASPISVSDEEREKNNINMSTSTMTRIDVNLLESSSLYKVQTTSVETTNQNFPAIQRGIGNIPLEDGLGPSVDRVSKEHLIHVLKSKRAVFLGEHHPSKSDHLLQAEIIRSLYNTMNIQENEKGGSTPTTPRSHSHPLAVGLEAVQRQFQYVLDQYCTGSIDEEALRKQTEWDSRWYWSFDAYRPIFQTCRELGIRLLALDISTEDRKLVESDGIEALDNKKFIEYVPDLASFTAFGSTKAYDAFVSHTLKPPYELQQRTPLGKQINFSNFLARQMLRDEAMASATVRWLSRNPDGTFVGCIGINHATFGCGVPGRVEKQLFVSASSSLSNDQSRNQNKCETMVTSLLINPEPLNTNTELKICKTEGFPPIDDEDNNNGRLRSLFIKDARASTQEVCIENSFELQNYVLEISFIPPSLRDDQDQRGSIINEATASQQVKQGGTTLGLADYLVFSPKKMIMNDRE